MLMSEIADFNYKEINSRIIEGDHFDRSLVAREIIRAIQSSDISNGPLILSTLITGYEESYALRDYSVAHEFAVGLSYIGNEVEGPSRIAEVCLLLGNENLVKAELAASTEDYGRASNKAVWASERLSEARRYGAQGIDELIMKAARLTIQTAPLNSSSVRETESFEDPILSDLTESEAAQIKLEIIELRKQLFDSCEQQNISTDESPWYTWLRAYEHALVIQKYGADDCEGLLNKAGLNAFEAAYKEGNYTMASYIASFKLTHLTEAEQWTLINRIPIE